MKILHCCLAAFYIDNFGYQENILPKMHKIQGHEVSILASTETYLPNGTLGYMEAKSYVTKDGIPITRLSYIKWVPHFIIKKLRIYDGITNFLQYSKPDIIFLHDLQFISIYEIVNYVRKNKNVKIYVDGHTDFINSGRNLISKYFLHKIIYKWCAKKIEPYAKKFYGTLPIRNDFFHDVYDIAKEKIELLPFGADNTLFNLSERNKVKLTVLKELEIKNDDFVVITGGKIDKRKNIHLLLRAINELDKEKIKLIIFGTVSIAMDKELKQLTNTENVRFIGWVNPKRIYQLFLASDLGVFPGTHSVLWEQAIGVGLPCIFNKWEGIQHVDLGGNCSFINGNEIKEIKGAIYTLYNNSNKIQAMKRVAMEKGSKYFSYFNIAKRAIEK